MMYFPRQAKIKKEILVDKISNELVLFDFESNKIPLIELCESESVFVFGNCETLKELIPQLKTLKLQNIDASINYFLVIQIDKYFYIKVIFI